MERSEITNQISEIYIKISKSNKELEELELKYKKKKLEIRKYKNEAAGLKLKLQELELNNFKENQKKRKINKIENLTLKKYADTNNQYYSQEKCFSDSDDSYKSYLEKNVLPYNE